jgi:hypothetical protein
MVAAEAGRCPVRGGLSTVVSALRRLMLGLESPATTCVGIGIGVAILDSHATSCALLEGEGRLGGKVR